MCSKQHVTLYCIVKHTAYYQTHSPIAIKDALVLLSNIRSIIKHIPPYVFKDALIYIVFNKRVLFDNTMYASLKTKGRMCLIIWHVFDNTMSVSLKINGGMYLIYVKKYT